MAASLGDAYPLNLKFTKRLFDGSALKSSDKLLNGIMTGYGDGRTLGRMSDVVYVSPNKFAILYSRKAGTSFTGEVSTNNDFGILFYNTNLELLS